MKIYKEKIVCFTGYRTSKILRTSNNPNLLQKISTDIENNVLTLYEQGYDTFISGMSEGFDMISAEVVLKLRVTYPDIKLIAVIPFMGQELSYSMQDKKMYD